MDDKKLYFRGLNGIRAIAVLIVLFFHIDQSLYLFGKDSIGYHNTGMAGFAVVLFFVLSGFLITFLLLSEKERFTKINFPKFYIRRVLRIWPIYYLVIIITVFLVLLHAINYEPEKTTLSLLIYSLLLSNVGFTFGLGLITIYPLWSVGVEEQFYLFWPLILQKGKNTFTSIVVFIICFWIVKLIIYLAFKLDIRYASEFYAFVNLTAFDTMAIGALMAWLVRNGHKILKVVFNPFVQIFSWLFLIISIFYKPVHVASLFDLEIHAIVYAVIIANVSSNPKTIISLENSFLNFTGRISYGIYIYHMTIIFLSSYFFKWVFNSPDDIKYYYIYIWCTGQTFLISYLSYHYFERFFLDLKKKYSLIHSTNELDTKHPS